MARPMRMNECRTTRYGVRYCRTPVGVRFVGGGGGRRSRGYAGNFSGGGRKMRMGECRRTRNGVKYCRTRAGVRFRSG